MTTEAGRETGGPTDACEGDCIASFRGLRALGVAESSKHIAWLYTDDLGKATLAWCDRDAATCEPSTVAIGGDPYTLVGTPDGIYAATTGGSSGRIMRLDPAGIVQAAVQAANGQFAQPVVLFAASDALYFVDYFDAPEAVGIFRRSLGGTEETPSKVVPLDGSNMHRWAQMLTVGERNVGVLDQRDPLRGPVVPCERPVHEPDDARVVADHPEPASHLVRRDEALHHDGSRPIRRRREHREDLRVQAGRVHEGRALAVRGGGVDLRGSVDRRGQRDRPLDRGPRSAADAGGNPAPASDLPPDATQAVKRGTFTARGIQRRSRSAGVA